MIQRLLDAWLRIAARGWPAERRADLVSEWQAELHALAAEPGRPAVVRAWRRLWFAGSLVLARRTGIGGVAGRASNVDGQVWPALVLFATPFVAVFPVVGTILTELVARSTLASTALLIGATVVLTGIATWIGVGLGGRSLALLGPSAATFRGRLAALVPVLCGVVVAGTTPAGRGLSPSPGDDIALALVGTGTLGLLLVPASALAVRVSGRTRSRVGRGLLLVSLSLAVALASVAVTVWFSGDRPAWAAGRAWWWLGLLDGVEPGHHPLPPAIPSAIPVDVRPIELALLRLPGALLVGAALMLALTMRLSATASKAAAVPARSGDDLAPEPGRWWAGTLLAGAACCVVVWAVALTEVTPHVGSSKAFDSEVLPPGLLDPWPGWRDEGRVWMQDMQLAAIVGAVLFFLCAGAYRGLPVAPGLTAGVALLVADTVVVRLGLLRLWLLPWLIAGGLCLGVLAWQRALRSGRASSGTGNRGRPLVVLASVLAAFLVPSLYSGWTSQGSSASTPPGLVLVVVGVPTLFATLAALGITATTQRRLPGSVWTLPAVALTATAIAAAMRLYVPWPNDMVNGMSRALIMFLSLATAPALAWLTYALIIGRPRSPLLLAQTSLGLAVIGLPMVLPTLIGSALLGGTLLAPMGYGHSHGGDGMPYLPGAFLVGLVLGVLARRDVVRAKRPAAEQPPVPA